MLLSLFSGCGGLDLGFERAGFEIGLAYDIRTDSIASWNRNRNQNDRDGTRGHVTDLCSIQLADMDRDYGSRFMPSAVIGGPPCQSFSPANRSPLANDPRSGLVHRFFTIALRLHRHRRPLDFILMENVPGFKVADDGRLLDRELKRLNTSGFFAKAFFVNAVCHSVPQDRNRLFILALPRNKKWIPPVGTETRKTVKNAIGDLPEPVRFTRDLNPKDFPHHPNHWCMMPKSRRFSDGSLSEGDSSARSFKTLAWNKPSITASYGHREVHVHPNRKRRLSVFEAMKLQGFPDDYVLEGPLSGQIDQVSGAVPPPLAEAVAKSIATAIATPATTTSVGAHDPRAPSCARAFGS